MYRKILVPVDGSKVAECSLNHVVEVAKGCCVGKVTLIMSLEPIIETGFYGLQIEVGATAKVEAAQKAAATAYLKKAAALLSKKGVNVGTVVTRGESADAILF